MREIGVIASNARSFEAPMLVYKDAEGFVKEEMLVVVEDVKFGGRKYLGVLRFVTKLDPLLTVTQRSAVIEAIILLLCSPIPWFFSVLSYIAGFLFSRGVHSKLVAELLIASGVASFVIGSALLITFNFSLASLPNMLVHQLETGALGFWSFLLGILGFILLAVIEKIGLLYMFAVIPMVTGVALILMGIRRRLKLEVY